jgi:acetyl-CoA carboxylase carboxyl transferase subunit alpha
MSSAKTLPASGVTSPLTGESLQLLAYEKSLALLEQQITELESMAAETAVNVEAELTQLRQQAQQVKQQLYQQLSPGQKLQVARHPQRPNVLEVIQRLSPNTWVALHGDRMGADDKAMIGGIAELGQQPIMVVGTQKGRTMKENLLHNFGMAAPEGYRKARRLFEHAAKFRMPILTLIDTPGALKANSTPLAMLLPPTCEIWLALMCPLLALCWAKPVVAVLWALAWPTTL